LNYFLHKIHPSTYKTPTLIKVDVF